MKVKALADGTIGKGSTVRRVRKGDIFTLPDGLKVSTRWMQVVSDAAKPEAKAKGKARPEPTTLSELSRATAPVLAAKGDEDLV